MASKFEKVSKKEVETFNLDKLWNYYHVGALISLPDICFEHYWTVDKKRKIWIYDMNHCQSNWHGERYLFYYNKRIIEIVIKSDINSSSSLDDVPFIKNIDFVSINFKLLDDVEFDDNIELVEDSDFIFEGAKSIDKFNHEEIKNVFKEALLEFLTKQFFRLRPNHPNYILNCRW